MEILLLGGFMQHEQILLAVVAVEGTKDAINPPSELDNPLLGAKDLFLPSYLRSFRRNDCFKENLVKYLQRHYLQDRKRINYRFLMQYNAILVIMALDGRTLVESNSTHYV